jgi:uncharacterized protein YkwD
VRRLIPFVLAALVVAPAGLAAHETQGAGVDRLLGQTSYSASPAWKRLALSGLSTRWHTSSLGSSEQQTALATAILQGINLERRTRGLKALVTSTKLAAAAAQHTREMGSQGYFEHESFDATPFWKRIERWYPSKGWRSWSVGENLLYSSPTVTAEKSIELWMSSPPHRANMLGRSWREIGISAIHFESAPGEYEGQPATIVTADFGIRR